MYEGRICYNRRDCGNIAPVRRSVNVFPRRQGADVPNSGMGVPPGAVFLTVVLVHQKRLPVNPARRVS